jgi:hydrogenase-4 component B
MMSLTWILAAGAGAGLSGVPALLPARGGRPGQFASTAAMLVSCALGVSASAAALLAGTTEALTLPWSIPGAALAVDPLSAWFLLPVFLVPGLGALFSHQYWPAGEHPRAGRTRLFYGLLPAGMVALLVARDSVLFLTGWEVMALSAFFLVATEDSQEEVRRAAWVYLVATHIGTVALIAMFSLVRQAAGSLDWAALAAAPPGPWQAAAILLLALIGFGMKAGLMPLHVWLPPAHASAPSHVSALMSGVMIKMGVYGLARVTALLPAPPLPWGLLLMVGGTAGALIAAAAALGQQDLKRMLAYSSVENIGVILAGLGLALAGRALRQPAWAGLGLAGALLHTLNHSLFKSLLFLGAGSVQHAAGTRRMDLLGGLAHAMPVTFAAWVAGALAVSAVPGLNGLPGEFAIYAGLFGAVQAAPPLVALIAVGCMAALALTGALALASMVRAVAVVFLGLPRSERAESAHEPSGPITAVLAVLTVLCVGAALLPHLAGAPLARVVGLWSGAPAADPAPLLRPLGWLALAVMITVGSATLWLIRAGKPHRANGRGPVGTWDCGYAGTASGRIQYTSSSFMALLARWFAWVAPPRPLLRAGPGFFPGDWAFATAPLERLLDRVVFPFCRRMAGRFARIRVVQQGVLHLYLLYILGALMLAIAWAGLSPWGAG